MTKEIKEELREKLAEIEHQRWADWQKWCHKVLRENCPSLELEKVLKRWDKQIATDYKDLTEKEKDSDRKQVDGYWSLIQKALSNNTKRVKKEIESIVSKHIGSCDHPCEECRTAREILKEIEGTHIKGRKRDG